ncbi:MAG: hypothetical protein ACE5EQ_08350 [Phycisphaerae bacterium]
MPKAVFRIRPLLAVVAWVLVPVLWAGCTGPSDADRLNEVIVMGMIHDTHRTSTLYGIDRIKQIVRRIDPDYILCEIPPDRIARATKEFRETNTISEPRVRRFPEYVDAIFPLTRELSFEIVPCAGWTRAMADDRAAKLKKWEKTRPADSRAVQAAEDRADALIEAEGMSEDPLKIHTDRYDAIVKEGLEPYNRLFNDDLGPGGWDNINAAHYGLIAEALDAHRGEGKRFLIMFGSWHKYWILEKLRSRTDIRLISLIRFAQDR